MSDNAKLRIGEKNPFYGKTHTEKTKQKLRESSTGNIPITAVKVIIDNIEYESMTEASIKLEIPVPTISWRIKSKNLNFTNYKYVDESYTTKTPCKIIINNVLYNSISQASNLLKYSEKYIRRRLKSVDNEDKDWAFSTEKQDKNKKIKE